MLEGPMFVAIHTHVLRNMPTSPPDCLCCRRRCCHSNSHSRGNRELAGHRQICFFGVFLSSLTNKFGNTDVKTCYNVEMTEKDGNEVKHTYSLIYQGAAYPPK